MAVYYKHVDTTNRGVIVSTGFANVGGANLQTSIGDAVGDATYIYRTGTTGTRTFTAKMESTLRTSAVPGSTAKPIPATGEEVKSVRCVFRKQSHNGTSAPNTRQEVSIGVMSTTSGTIEYGASTTLVGASNTVAVTAGTANTYQPDYSPWDAATVSGSNMYFRFVDSGLTSAGGNNYQTRVTLAYLEVTTVSVPVVGAATVSDETNTAASASIASIAFASPTVTVTTVSPHGFTAGQSVTIAGATASGNNGTFTIATAPTATTFTISNASGAAQTGVGGQVARSNALTSSLTPTVGWTFYDADSGTQSEADVLIFTADQYNAAGFSIDRYAGYTTATPTDQFGNPVDLGYSDLPVPVAWSDDGRYGGQITTGQSWQVPVPLNNNGTYRAYLYVRKAGMSTLSPWAYVQFTTSVESGVTPPAPGATATWDATNQRATVAVAPPWMNLLSKNDANFEVSIGTWTVGAGGVTLTRTTTAGQYYSGVAGLSAVSVNTSNMRIRSGGSTVGEKVPITPGMTYAASIWARTNASGRIAAAHVIFYTAANAAIASILGPQQVVPTGSWTLLTAFTQAPSNAAYAAVAVDYGSPNTTNNPYGAIAIGDALYLDRPMLTAASSASEPMVRTNLVRNPSFETGASNWLTYGSASIAGSTERAVWGGSSGKITWPTGTGTGVYSGVTLVPGQQYVFSAWLYVPTGSPNVILTDGGGASLSPAMTVKDTWTRTSFLFTATSTSHSINVTPTTASTAGQVCYVDGAMVEPVSIIPNSGFETDTTGWHPGNAATLNRTVTSPPNGTGALWISTGASTFPYAYTDYHVIDPAYTYTLSASATNVSGTTRSLSANVVWVDALGTPIGNPSTAIEWLNVAAGAAYASRTLTVTPPAGAAGAYVRLFAAQNTTTAGWVSGFDNVQFGPASAHHPLPYFDGSGDTGGFATWAGGSSATADAHASISRSGAAWATGGMTHTGTRVTRTDANGSNVPVRGLVTYLTSTGALATSSSVVTVGDTVYANGVSVLDVEPYRGGTVTYSVASTFSDGTSLLSTSSYSASVTTTNDGKTWLKAITGPSLSRIVNVLADPTFEVQEETGVFKPRGRGYTLVVSGGLYGTSGSFAIMVTTAADWPSVRALLEHRGVLLWQDQYGNDRWIRLTSRSYTHSGLGNRQIRRVSCSYEEVGAV